MRLPTEHGTDGSEVDERFPRVAIAMWAVSAAGAAIVALSGALEILDARLSGM